MNRSQKIAAGVSALAVMSLAAVAGSAIASVASEVGSWPVFGTGLFYLNDVHLQGTIQPGDVMRLRP